MKLYFRGVLGKAFGLNSGGETPIYDGANPDSMVVNDGIASVDVSRIFGDDGFNSSPELT